jgi:hypothetical protein
MLVTVRMAKGPRVGESIESRSEMDREGSTRRRLA